MPNKTAKKLPRKMMSMRKSYLVCQLSLEGFSVSNISTLLCLTPVRVFQILNKIEEREKLPIEVLEREDKKYKEFMDNKLLIRNRAKKITQNFFRKDEVTETINK